MDYTNPYENLHIPELTCKRAKEHPNVRFIKCLQNNLVGCTVSLMFAKKYTQGNVKANRVKQKL